MMRSLLAFTGVLAAYTATAQALPSSTADDLFRNGVKACNMGDYPRAADLFTQVIQMDPENLNAYLQRGICFSLQQNYQAAVADLSAVIQRKPDHQGAYASRGSAYNKWGKPEQAVQDFDTALAMDPSDQETFNNRGWAKKALGDPDGACADWNSSRKLGNAEAKIILKNNRCN
ncbi:MAG: tetratricopeptide repeat protein [Flavobacteriales bacterium]|nr:tetratricopeptide repeat protein [Flavobacteriales bacterium]